MLTRLAAAAVLALAFISRAQAFGLGELTVESSLGAPLRAEIRVLDLAADEAGSLRAAVATPDIFKAAGADYHPALPTVTISVYKRADGTTMLRLAGTRPVEDEFIDLIVEATTAHGRVLRDYTLQLSGRPRPQP